MSIFSMTDILRKVSRGLDESDTMLSVKIDGSSVTLTPTDKKIKYCK